METGEIFYQAPENHLLSAPENRTIKRDTESFIQKSIEIHGAKYDYSRVEYTLSSQKVEIICPRHGSFWQVANSHIMGMGCKRCGFDDKAPTQKPKYTTEEFIAEAMSVWGNKYDYSLVDYVNIRTKVKIIYDGIIYEQTPASHLKYPPERFMNQEIFLIRSKRKWGDKYDYSLAEYVSTKFPVKIIYEGEIYEQLPPNQLIYAPELRNTTTHEDFIERSKEIHNGKYTYDKAIYTNDRTLVTITCPRHGDFRQTPTIHLRGSGCKRCSESFGEKEISRYLDEKTITYTREHKFDDCRNIYPLKFDFYIPSMRLCIEFDGIQHYEPIDYFGGVDAYERLKANDKIKDEYCEDNYIDLIRIRYDQIDQIPAILKECLKNRI
jgi:very-short-patch-repair endonuclease